VEAISVRWIVRAVDAVAVKLSGPYVGQVTVPDLIGPLADADLVGFDRVVLTVEETQLDASRVFGKEGEVHTLAIPRRSEWVWLAGPDTHFEFAFLVLCLETLL